MALAGEPLLVIADEAEALETPLEQMFRDQTADGALVGLTRGSAECRKCPDTLTTGAPRPLSSFISALERTIATTPSAGRCSRWRMPNWPTLGIHTKRQSPRSRA